jgi:aminopeptidase
MLDPRITKLAENIVTHSLDVQPGENVLIEYSADDRALALELIRLIAERGGKPFVKLTDNRLIRQTLIYSTEEYIRFWAENDLAFMKQMQGYVSLGGANNISELSDVPPDKMKLYRELYVTPVHFEQRVKHTKWCLLRFPDPSMSQLANMSTEAFENLYRFHSFYTGRLY